jgi:predicted transcriptional regulator
MMYPSNGATQMTENLADLQKQLAELNKAIELQKALDKLAKVPVSHRTMQKREALEQAFRKVK